MFRVRSFDVLGYLQDLLLVVVICLLSMMALLFRLSVFHDDSFDSMELVRRRAATLLA